MAVTAMNSTPTEGTVATTIEQQTSQIPSDWFLWAAVGSIVTSLTLQVGGKTAREHVCRAIGTDVPDSGPLQETREAVPFRSHESSRA